jgi:O-antigen ligase
MNRTKKILKGVNLEIILLGIYLCLVMIFDSRPNMTKLVNVFFVFYFTISLIRVLTKGRISFSKHISWFYAYWFLLIVGTLYSTDKDYSIGIVTTYLLLNIFSIVVANNIVDNNDMKKVVLIFLIAGVINALYAVQFYGLKEISNSIIYGRRLGWEISAPNSYGLYSAITAIILVYFYISGKNKLALLLSAIPITIMLTSYSKKAFLFFIVCLLSLVVFKYKKKSIKMIIKVSAILVIVFLILQIPVLETLNLRLGSLFSIITRDTTNTSFVDSSDQLRVQLITEGIEMLKKAPLIGNGTGAYRFISLIYFGKNIASHNNFIEILVNNGIIGFLIYYIPILLLIFNGFKISIVKNDYLGWLLFTLLMGTTFIHGASAIVYTDKIYWFILTCNLAYFSKFLIFKLK